MAVCNNPKMPRRGILSITPDKKNKVFRSLGCEYGFSSASRRDAISTFHNSKQRSNQS